VKNLDEMIALEASREQEKQYYNELKKEEMQRSASMSIHLRRNTAIDRVLERKCFDCNSMMPSYTYHCHTCQRCTVNMDHHCPWINNCVGYFNQKPFVLFTAYGLIVQLYASLILQKLFSE